jgi:hypothetical protein
MKIVVVVFGCQNNSFAIDFDAQPAESSRNNAFGEVAERQNHNSFLF